MSCVITQVGIDGQRGLSAMEGRGMDRRHSRAYTWTRRGFLGLTAGATLGAYGWSLGLAADVPSAFDGRSFQLRAPEPTPKRGGGFRYGVLRGPTAFLLPQPN